MPEQGDCDAIAVVEKLAQLCRCAAPFSGVRSSWDVLAIRRARAAELASAASARARASSALRRSAGVAAVLMAAAPVEKQFMQQRNN